ncbi:MAG TPA: site-2 protease family protein [Gemmataceae bacterium]|nr:site-2 protease family protein [Gemmataceae bacterium]
MLFEPERTQFDLKWRMFGIPVRVHPMFWLITCVSGNYYLERYGAVYLLLWVACFFVSILVHELGHVFMGRIFGRHGEIVLYGFGGLAIGSYDLPKRWQRIAISFAGPLAGFCLLGVVLLIRAYAFPERRDVFRAPDVVWTAADMLLLLNLIWGLINLLPVWPLDGGQVSREVFTGMAPRQGLRIALGLSFILASGLAILFVVYSVMLRQGTVLLPFMASEGAAIDGIMPAILFALLAVESLMLALQTRRPRRYQDDDDDPWAR